METQGYTYDELLRELPDIACGCSDNRCPLNRIIAFRMNGQFEEAVALLNEVFTGPLAQDLLLIKKAVHFCDNSECLGDQLISARDNGHIFLSLVVFEALKRSGTQMLVITS